MPSSVETVDVARRTSAQDGSPVKMVDALTSIGQGHRGDREGKAERRPSDRSSMMGVRCSERLSWKLHTRGRGDRRAARAAGAAGRKGMVLASHCDGKGASRCGLDLEAQGIRALTFQECCGGTGPGVQGHPEHQAEVLVAWAGEASIPPRSASKGPALRSIDTSRGGDHLRQSPRRHGPGEKIVRYRHTVGRRCPGTPGPSPDVPRPRTRPASFSTRPCPYP